MAGASFSSALPAVYGGSLSTHGHMEGVPRGVPGVCIRCVYGVGHSGVR